MLSQDTKQEVFNHLVRTRYAQILDMRESDCAYGIEWKSFDDMTDAEIVDEYECSYNVHPDDDDLYDKMIAEMEAHKMLKPTTSTDKETT